MKDLVKLLYDLSLQSSGFTIENSSDFIKRVLNLINNDLTLFKSDNLEEIIAN
jgi:HSP90 family molecular chaperone